MNRAEQINESRLAIWNFIHDEFVKIIPNAHGWASDAGKAAASEFLHHLQKKLTDDGSRCSVHLDTTAGYYEMTGDGRIVSAKGPKIYPGDCGMWRSY